MFESANEFKPIMKHSILIPDCQEVFSEDASDNSIASCQPVVTVHAGLKQKINK